MELLFAQTVAADPLSLTQVVVGVTISIIVFTGVVWTAAQYVKSSVQKQRHEELAELADTRGKRVDDLEDEVRALRDVVKNLEGQMVALQGLKMIELADEMQARLEPRLANIEGLLVRVEKRSPAGK